MSATVQSGALPAARRRPLQRFRRDRVAVAGLAILFVAAILTAVGSLVAPMDPNAQDSQQILLGPTGSHLLGTDHLGRDVASRLIAGTRTSLFAGVGAVAVAMALGLPLGMIAGFARGPIDSLVSRVADAFLSMPGIILAMAIVGIRGAGLTNVIIALGVMFWPRVFRLVRVQTLLSREQGFVEAARSYGCPARHIVVRHVLPNIASAVMIQAAFLVGVGIIAEASLSFVGFGVEPPQSSWGLTLHDGYEHLYEQPILILWPTLFVVLTVWAFASVADGLRDSMSRQVREPGSHG